MPVDALGLLSPARADLPPGDQGSVITSVETYALSVPLPQTVADSTASLQAWTVPVVEIPTADGRYYAPALVGACGEDILGTWKRLYWLPTHLIGRAGVVHIGLSRDIEAHRRLQQTGALDMAAAESLYSYRDHDPGRVI